MKKYMVFKMIVFLSDKKVLTFYFMYNKIYIKGDVDMKEIWKDIPDYKGYQASNLGRIRTYNKITYTKIHGERHWKNKILKFKPDYNSKNKNKQGTGYRVTLWKNGRGKDFLVARLIATTFLEDFINTKMTVNHKNGNRLDNRVENLEWLSLADNIKYGFENGQYKQHKTILYNENERYEFRSKSLASQFLNRNDGYISMCLKNKRKAKSKKTNKEYNIECII